MKRPLISIIIPVYNVEKHLNRCLDSVSAQTFDDFEIICINDGCTDKSAVILEEYAQKDARVKIITQPNMGQAAARNNGLKAAAGEFICFVDSDDFVHPQMLEISLDFARKHNADLVTFRSDMRIHNAFKKNNNDPGAHNPPEYKNIDGISFKITENPLRFFRKNITYKMTYHVWGRLYAKNLLKGLEFLPGNCFEDDPFIMAVCARHPKTVLLKEPLYFYIHNPHSISGKTKNNILPKHIKDYYEGTLYIYEQYKNASKKELDFVADVIIPRRLRIQYKKIKRAGAAKRAELLRIFTNELTDLQKKGLLPFSFNPRTWFYRFKYRQLIKLGDKK